MTDPAYVKAFKEYTRGDPTKDDLPAMAKEFYGKSTRAVVILQATMVEGTLANAIESVLHSDLSKTKLFDFEGPLGTFSAKIAIAYALGIFGPKTRHDLDLIRLLRNGFAHCSRPMSFSTTEVAAVCKYLQVPSINGIGITPQGFLKTKRNFNPNLQDPKTRYISACYSIARHLLDFIADKKIKKAYEKALNPKFRKPMLP